MQIKQERDWFKATGSLQIDDTLALDLRTLLDMLSRATGRFVPLDDGTFLGITGQLRKRLEELNAFSEGHGKGVRFAPLAALALEDLTEDVGHLQTDKAWTQHCKRLKEVAKPQIPSTLQGSLRDYQQTGFYWLAQLSHWGVGACLADDMGLGKTIQALAAILLRSSHGPTLIVAPLSVTSNWQDEASRFAPTLNVIVFGPGDRRQIIDNLQPFDLLIVSYGLLPLETELLSGVKWQTVVLDEAQAIKNMQTKRSKAAMDLQAEFRVITTGTPVENHLSELWTLFNFLNPGLLGSYKKFNEKFAIPIERDQDNEVRNLLRKLIRPFILRRLKSDVLQELPAKTEITLEVEMSNDELLLYEAQRLRALENINAHSGEGAGQTHLRILGEIMKLRRLCCNPSLVLPDCNIASSKLKVFGDTLQELRENKHKALVFSQFVGHLEIIRHYLETKNISYQYLDGSTSLKDRKQRITDFQNGQGDVFLISLKAGGAGLNLTAADYVIHMDPWWNPAVEDQASDRAHRIGQKRPVTVYRLVVKNSIEEQIVDLHKQKRDLADSLLEGTDAAGKVSAKELLGLLQGKNQPGLN
jgi:SNF2 family DNA or RNA helicase